MSKLLDTAGKQVLRGYCLKICEQAEPLGAGTEVICATLKNYGFGYEREDVEEACEYLERKGLVRIERVTNDVLGIRRSIAHITARGCDVLEGYIQAEGVEAV